MAHLRKINLRFCKNKWIIIKHFHTSVAHPEHLNDLASTFSEHITSLDETDKLSYEGQVSEEECLKALHDFKNEKSPGTDGLPAEFYKFF